MIEKYIYVDKVKARKGHNCNNEICKKPMKFGPTRIVVYESRFCICCGFKSILNLKKKQYEYIRGLKEAIQIKEMRAKNIDSLIKKLKKKFGKELVVERLK